jgi:hypothetical protein
LPSIADNTPGRALIAGSTSALDFLRRLVLPRRGNVSDEWLRQALADVVSQPRRRFGRDADVVQQFTAARLAGFGVTVRQAYELAGRLDKMWRNAGFSSRMSQLQLTEKLLESVGAPGNFRALCKAVASEQPGRAAGELAVMMTTFGAIQALPPQAWPEEGARLKFQEGIGSQIRDMQPKAFVSVRRPSVTAETPSDAQTRDPNHGALRWFMHDFA